MTDTKVTYNSKTMQDTDKCIDKAVGSWQAARKYTQVALVSIVQSLYLHGDRDTAVKRAERLIAGAVGANTKAIVEWLVQMGFKVDEKGTKIASAPENDALKECVGDNYSKAKALHWWDLKPMNAFAGFDLASQLKALVEKAEKMEKAANDDPEKASVIKIDQELLSNLEQLVA